MPPLVWTPLLLVAAQALGPATPIPLFDGAFEQWIVEQVAHPTATGAPPAVYNDAVLIAHNVGWFRTKRPYGDFRLSLEFRADPRARAALYFRTWTG